MAVLVGGLVLTCALALMAHSIGANPTGEIFWRIPIYASKTELEKPPSVDSYYVVMKVGSPPKRFKMLLDINSAEVMIPHAKSALQMVTNLNYIDGYKESKSDTSKTISNLEHEIKLFDCFMQGSVYRDKFCFALDATGESGVFERNFIAPYQATTNLMSVLGVEGILGLAYQPRPTHTNVSTIGELCASHPQLEQKFVITFNRTRKELEKSTEPVGQLTLGAAPQLVAGNSSQPTIGHKIVGHRDWWLILDDVAVGEQKFVSKRHVQIVTKSNFIHGPRDQVKNIYQALLGADYEAKRDAGGLYETKCIQDDSEPADVLPSVQFIIGEGTYTMEARNFVRARSNGSCFVGIIEHNESYWVLGTSFLRNYHTVFDGQDKTVAFVQNIL